MIIKNGMVWSMEQDPQIMDIEIQDGVITAIGHDLKGDDVMDATGKVVFPGFIDAHCHIGMFESGIGFEGDDGNEITDPVTPQLRAIDGINPMDENFEHAYQGGVTAVATGPGSANVLGGTFVAMKTYGHRIDDMIIKNPVAMKCAFGENVKRCYQEKSIMTRMANAAKLRETLAKAKEYAMKKAAAEADPSKMPAYDMKMEALLPVIRKEIPLKAHAHRADDIFTSIRIAKEFDVRLTMEHCTEGHLIVEDLVKEGLPANCGPSLSDKSKFELKNLTFETPGILSKHGIRVSIITDSPVIPLEYLPMCAALAVKHGMDEYEAYKAITINPAKTLGIDERVGSLAIGKDADIVIWDGMPFELQSKVDTTIVNGTVVYRKDGSCPAL